MMGNQSLDFHLKKPPNRVVLCMYVHESGLLSPIDCHVFTWFVCMVTGGKDGILNPMVHNMAPAYEAAKYEVIWVSTSRIKGNHTRTHW